MYDYDDEWGLLIEANSHRSPFGNESKRSQIVSARSTEGKESEQEAAGESREGFYVGREHSRRRVVGEEQERSKRGAEEEAKQNIVPN